MQVQMKRKLKLKNYVKDIGILDILEMKNELSLMLISIKSFHCENENIYDY